jgi:hypothetical protein
MSKDTTQVISNMRIPLSTRINDRFMVELSPYQYMLLSQYYRICSLPSQQATVSDKIMSKLCGFSISKVKSTRKELAELGYINIKNRIGDTLKVTIVEYEDQ